MHPIPDVAFCVHRLWLIHILRENNLWLHETNIWHHVGIILYGEVNTKGSYLCLIRRLSNSTYISSLC